MVPWCGQTPDCGHPACTDALARCAAPHQLDGRRFHGPVSVILIDSHLWDHYDQAAVKADTGIRPTRAAEMFTDSAQDNRPVDRAVQGEPIHPAQGRDQGLRVRRGDRQAS